MSPVHPSPCCRVGASLLAYANCCPNEEYGCGEPPNGQALVALDPQPGNAEALNLKTNHHATGCPFVSIGYGAWQGGESGVPPPHCAIPSMAVG